MAPTTKSSVRVLIVQRDWGYARQLEAWFAAAGYQPVLCPGPHPPDYHCFLLESAETLVANAPSLPRSEAVRCPIVERADVLIYDPWLYVAQGSADATQLLRVLRERYPHQPLVLAWPEGLGPASAPQTPPDSGIHYGPADPLRLVEFIDRLVAAGAGGGPAIPPP